MRRRAVLIAYRADLGMLPRLPKATHERIGKAKRLMEAGERIRFQPSKLPYISVEEAIGDLPPLAAGEGDELLFYSSPPVTEYQKWAREDSIALYNHRSRSHTADYLKNKLSLIEEGGRNQELPAEQRFSDNYFSQAYARLHRNGIAQTITTHFANPGSGRFIHYRDLRSITVREAARLQSFPDRFVFDGIWGTQMRHVGNAVPPLMAQALRTVIGQDLLSVGAHLATKPVGRPKQPRPPEIPERRSRVMRAVPSKNSAPELALRRALVSANLRGYRLHRKDLPGSPDIVFPKAKLAVFVDGCFWHGCPTCYRAPKEHADYWTMKVNKNRERDLKAVERLSGAGWTVMRIWEHEVSYSADGAAKRVRKALRRHD